MQHYTKPKLIIGMATLSQKTEIEKRGAVFHNDALHKPELYQRNDAEEGINESYIY